jgi:hypothetical protein
VRIRSKAPIRLNRFDVGMEENAPLAAAWLLLSALTHHVMRQFQLAKGAAPRVNGPKRTDRRVLESLRTLRFERIDLPAKLAQPERCAELGIAAPLAAQRRITQLLAALPAAV